MRSIACSSDGDKIVVTESEGDLDVLALLPSEDEEENGWTRVAGLGGPSTRLCVACSANAATIVTATLGENVWASFNEGVSWERISEAGAQQWQAMACSQDGSVVVAA